MKLVRGAALRRPSKAIRRSTVVAGLFIVLVGCSHFESSNQWDEWEARDELRDAIYRGDEQRVGALVRSNGDLRSGQSAYVAILAALCDPAMVEHLVDGLGVDPGAEYLGQSVMFGATYTERDCEGEVLAKSIELLLERGADPCTPPDDDASLVPALRAREWGNPEEVVRLLDEYKDLCG